MKMCGSLFRCHWNLFLWVEVRVVIGSSNGLADLVIDLYMSRRWCESLMPYCDTKPTWFFLTKDHLFTSLMNFVTCLFACRGFRKKKSIIFLDINWHDAHVMSLSSAYTPHRALIFKKKILNVCDISEYIIGTFMYECLNGNITDIFRNYFQRNAAVHDYNLRNANDLHVPYERLDIRKFRIKVTGANLCLHPY